MTILDDIQVISGKKKNSTPKKETSKKILIVEDEKPLADVLQDELIHQGFEVFVASNGKEGLEMAISYTPDLILLDLLMPVMDGKTMLHRLRDFPKFKTIPVIVLTNAGETENIRETQLYFNASEFLIKSNVSVEQIVTKIKSRLLI